MNKLQVVAQHAARVIERNSPHILLAVGLVGMVSGTVMAVRVTPRAREILDAADIQSVEGRRDKVLRFVKLCWRLYLPAAAVEVLGGASIIASHGVMTSRTVALTGTVATAQNLLRAYQDEMTDVLEEGVVEKIRGNVSGKILGDSADGDEPSGSTPEFVANVGQICDTLCYDSMSGRYFRSDMETIRSRINDFNQYLMRDLVTNVSVNDWYAELGLPETDLAADLAGWDAQHLLNIRFDANIAPNGVPCIVLDYSPSYPIPNSRM